MGQEKRNYPICWWTSFLAHAEQTGPRCIQGHGAREQHCNLLKRPVWEVRSGLGWVCLGADLITAESNAASCCLPWASIISGLAPLCTVILAVASLARLLSPPVSCSLKLALSGWAMLKTLSISLALFYSLHPSLKLKARGNQMQ